MNKKVVFWNRLERNATSRHRRDIGPRRVKSVFARTRRICRISNRPCYYRNANKITMPVCTACGKVESRANMPVAFRDTFTLCPVNGQECCGETLSLPGFSRRRAGNRRLLPLHPDRFSGSIKTSRRRATKEVARSVVRCAKCRVISRRIARSDPFFRPRPRP